MSREKNLLKNTLVLSVGRFLPKLLSFITLPILTAFLTKAEYGTYDLIATLVMLLIPIATLQIQSAAFRFLIECRGNKKESSVIISNIFIVTIPVSIVVSFIVQFFFSEYSLAIRILISLYLFLDTLGITMGQAGRGLGKNKEYTVAACVMAIANVVGIVICVYILKGGLLGLMVSLTISETVKAIYLVFAIRFYKFINLSYCSISKIKDLISYSWPMVPNNLSTWVLKLSDRLVITAVLGVEANAVYAVANKIPNMLSIAQSVMVMAWQENASIAVNDKDSSAYFSRMLETTFNLMIGITALLIAGTPLIFKVLIHGDYDESYYQIPILILAMFFFVMSSYFGGLYIAHKRTVNVGVTTMVAAAINLAIDCIFVQWIGIWAGSISTLIAYAFLYYYRMFNCQKFQKVDVRFLNQAMKLLVIIGMLFMCFQRNIIIDIFNVLISIIVVFAFNKDIIVKGKGRLKKKLNRTAR